MSSGPELDSPKKHGLAHAVWAALAASVCLFLILTKQTGHPPPITLVPFVLVAWVAGHGFIWGVRRLAERGRSVSAPADAEIQPWPIGLRLALVATGAAALVGIAQVLGTVLQREWYPYRYFDLWVTMLVVWLAHTASFAGLLMRKRWSGPMSAMLTIGWALLLVKQIAEQLGMAHSADTVGVLIAAGLIVLLLLFAAYLGWSREVRSFLVR
jgi:hypothetical protein